MLGVISVLVSERVESSRNHLCASADGLRIDMVSDSISGRVSVLALSFEVRRYNAQGVCLRGLPESREKGGCSQKGTEDVQPELGNRNK